MTTEKLRVQAQYLQPGDVVGSGAIVINVIIAGIGIPSGKVRVFLQGTKMRHFSTWGKYTMINITREKK